ncbi:MAG: hypothetical protein JSS93_09400 [Bacteroidetes bacterium]|nr:hypothetical protein [Bacteroidota bacterium]
MRKLAAIFFLILLGMPMVCKISLVSFYQLYRDYIALNYCINKDKPITMCYGRCFLERGLQLTDETSVPDQLTSQHKTEMPAFVPDSIKPIVSVQYRVSFFPKELKANLLKGYTHPLFRPPVG